VDIVSSALVVMLGLVLLFVIIPGWVPVESGPGFGLPATAMPNVAAATATALAALFFLYRLRNRRPRTEADDRYDATPPIGHENWLFLLRGGLFLIAVTVLFNWLGFLVAGPPTVAGFMIMMGEKKPWHVAITAVAATAAIWLFFWQFLKFPLP
jgi:hypothetical protein